MINPGSIYNTNPTKSARKLFHNPLINNILFKTPGLSMLVSPCLNYCICRKFFFLYMLKKSAGPPKGVQAHLSLKADRSFVRYNTFLEFVKSIFPIIWMKLILL